MKINNSNNLLKFQLLFYVPLVLCISGPLQLSQWQTNLKLHLLTKPSFDLIILEHISHELKSDVNINFGAFKSSIIDMSYFIRKFCSLSNEQSFLAFIKIIVDITIAPLNIGWLVYFEGEQLWLVHFNLTLTGAEIFLTACNN